MRSLLRTSIVLLALGAAPAWATLTDPPPANPCPGGAKLKMNLSVLDVSGDGMAPPCHGHNVETVITCTVLEVGAPVDIAIEYFDASGTLISPPVPFTLCGLVEGETVSFVTASPPTPYGNNAALVPTAPTVPGSPFCAPLTPGCFLHGSARVLATSKRIQCAGARIDLAGQCFGGPPLSLSTKDLTILQKGRQRGD